MRRRVLTATAIAAALTAGGCSGVGVLHPAGPVADANHQILLNSLAIMLAIVIPTILAALGFAWWFRAGNTRAHYDPQFVYSGRVEAIVWSIPLLTIMFLGGIIWIGSHELDPAKPLAAKASPIEVQVVSLDWKWLFIYPQAGIASVNRLVLPVGRPVHFSLTSASVMNSFFVPQLGSQIYTMNGMATQLNLQANKPGNYYGFSGHFSGDGFADMDFWVSAVPAAQFAGWLAAARGKGEPLDGARYAQLARQSHGVRPFTYGAVHPQLFDAIVTQRLLPAAGPQQGRGGPTVSPGDQK